MLLRKGLADLSTLVLSERGTMADHQHVVKRPDGWAVRGEGNKRDTVRGISTQEQASQRAEQVAPNKESDVIIHRPNGQIRDRDSYGNDPFPPRG